MKHVRHVVFVVLSSLMFGQASEIVFQATPSQVIEGLTPVLTLHCGLQKTATGATNSIIGRRDTDSLSRRDVTSTTDDMTEVSSLIIMRNGKDLASISHKSPAHLINSSSNLQVSGVVQSGGVEEGYLDLTIHQPTQSDLGELTCEINAVAQTGHSQVFSTSVEVNARPPTLADMVSYVKQLEGRVQQLEHKENGKVQCGNSDNWPGDNKDVRVNFKTSYSQPPIVHLGVTTFDFDTKHNDRHQASLLSVDKTGFTVRCHTWSDTHIYMMEVSWLSVAN